DVTMTSTVTFQSHSRKPPLALRSPCRLSTGKTRSLPFPPERKPVQLSVSKGAGSPSAVGRLEAIFMSAWTSSFLRNSLENKRTLLSKLADKIAIENKPIQKKILERVKEIFS